jgi:hypothetical protein
VIVYLASGQVGQKLVEYATAQLELRKGEIAFSASLKSVQDKVKEYSSSSDDFFGKSSAKEAVALCSELKKVKATKGVPAASASLVDKALQDFCSMLMRRFKISFAEVLVDTIEATLHGPGFFDGSVPDLISTCTRLQKNEHDVLRNTLDPRFSRLSRAPIFQEHEACSGSGLCLAGVLRSVLFRGFANALCGDGSVAAPPRCLAALLRLDA